MALLLPFITNVAVFAQTTYGYMDELAVQDYSDMTKGCETRVETMETDVDKMLIIGGWTRSSNIINNNDGSTNCVDYSERRAFII